VSTWKRGLISDKIDPVFAGLCGEYAAGLYLGTDIDLSLREYGDDGYDLEYGQRRIQVKTRTRDYGKLLIRRVAKKKLIPIKFDCVIGAELIEGGKEVKLLGWQNSVYALNDSTFSRSMSPRSNHYNLVLGDEQLQPLSRLKEWCSLGLSDRDEYQPTSSVGVIRYPGSKAKLRDAIIVHFPDSLTIPICSRRSRYIEPFFGSGAIGFDVMQSMSSDSEVVIGDIDYGLVCLWVSVRDVPEELIKLIDLFRPSVDQFFTFKESDGDRDSDPVLTGFRKLALHQMSMSGFGYKSGGPLGGKSQDSDYSVDCRWSPGRLASRVMKSHKIFNRFRRCDIVCRDFSKLLSMEGFAYCDPPYVQQGSALYRYAFDNSDHRRLAEILLGRSSDWVLSYDDDPLVHDLYLTCQIDSVEATYSSAFTNGTRPKNKELVIYPKGDSNA
jgi:DNA adenine methylase